MKDFDFVRISPRTALAASGLLILAACASAPPGPALALQAAEIAIANAEQANVAEYAQFELSVAREKLANARSAAAKHDMLAAAYLADESRVNAELASAKADAIKAKRVNEELSQSTEVLRQEMQRQETRPTTGGTKP